MDIFVALSETEALGKETDTVNKEPAIRVHTVANYQPFVFTRFVNETPINIISFITTLKRLRDFNTVFLRIDPKGKFLTNKISVES